jgi:hypothetical protein
VAGSVLRNPARHGRGTVLAPASGSVKQGIRQFVVGTGSPQAYH